MAKNTTPALPVWVQDYSLEDIGRRSGGTIHVYVHGYWGDVITIYVRREYDFEKSKAHLGMNEQPECYRWKIEMTHSSGGRDTGEIKDDVEAEANFAMGILAGVQTARLIRSQVEELDKYARLQDIAKEEHAEARRQEKLAAIAADEALGTDKAAALITAMVAKTNRRTEAQLKAYDRGSDSHPTVFTARMGRDNTIRFFKSGVMLSRVKAVQDLATFSVRSQLEV